MKVITLLVRFFFFLHYFLTFVFCVRAKVIKACQL